MATISKREEERNEKIIRGLMKLPPNRRCINCNNLGPQYVCSNFWTFVCMICSGIHREFTHRVKSVSMSKFTSQEVEALQNGGNQRARETYLKDWDSQRQRLPNSSDADKVREFIKAVYVDRKYAGGTKSDKSLKDSQTESNTGDEIRRASSYHSYSQSPPYDFQYEDRLNRKQGNSLSRKPGSDRGLYGRKAASFMYTPGSFSDHLSEDRFANEGSCSRVSDYSMSSGGDPFRSAPQSPNLQRDDEFSSPTFSPPEKVVDDLQHRTQNSYSESTKRDADKVPVPCPQRTVSWGTFGVIDKDSGSLESVGPASDSTLKHQSVISTQTKLSSFTPLSQLPEAHCSAPAVDLFQAPTCSVASIDLFQSPRDSTVHLQTSTSSLSYFSGATQNPSRTNLSPKLPEPIEEFNEGWATFDLPQISKPATVAPNAGIPDTRSEVTNSSKDLDSVASSNVGIPWQAFQNTLVNGPGASISDPWMAGLQDTQVTMSLTNSQPWNAFGEADGQQQPGVDTQGTNLQVSVENSSPAPNLFAEDSAKDGLQKLAPIEGFSFPNLSSHFADEISFNQPIHPFMNDVANIQQKSSNPFEIPFDSDFEASNAFLDISSLQAALPITTHPSPYAVDVHDSWFPDFPPHPMSSHDGMSFMAAHPPSSQLPNVPPTHGPTASVGGNPFA